MLGHPTGRLLLARDGYAVDLDAVIDAAAKAGTMIEINANPHRLDLDAVHCRRARQKGVTIVINPDAHSTQGLARPGFRHRRGPPGVADRATTCSTPHRWNGSRELERLRGVRTGDRRSRRSSPDSRRVEHRHFRCKRIAWALLGDPRRLYNDVE